MDIRRARPSPFLSAGTFRRARHERAHDGMGLAMPPFPIFLLAVLGEATKGVRPIDIRMKIWQGVSSTKSEPHIARHEHQQRAESGFCRFAVAGRRLPEQTTQTCHLLWDITLQRSFLKAGGAL